MKEKEQDLDNLIWQLQESSCNGFLSKMYSHCLSSLQKQTDIFQAVTPQQPLSSPFSRLTSSSSTPTIPTSNVNDLVRKAKQGKWDITKLTERLNEEKVQTAQTKEYDYDDKYIMNEGNKYLAFNFLTTIIWCSNDYLETSFSKIDSVSSLKDKMRKELDLRFMSTLEQRHNQTILQNPISAMMFFTFQDIVPTKNKMSRKCKMCRKPLIQVTDNLTSRRGASKLDPGIMHLFYTQFPVIYINKIDKDKKEILLKFAVSNFNETKLKLKEDITSPTKVVLPGNQYEIGTNTEVTGDECFHSKSDKYVILIFKIKEEYYQFFEMKRHHVLRFYCVVEYNRGGETATEIEYLAEVKFTINNNNSNNNSNNSNSNSK
jgi:hypothetical protein